MHNFGSAELRFDDIVSDFCEDLVNNLNHLAIVGDLMRPKKCSMQKNREVWAL